MRLNTTMSSTYAAQMCSKPRNTWSIVRWNVAGALTSPMGRTLYWYRPNGEAMALLSRCLGSSWIWKKPESTSSTEKMVIPCNWSNMLWTVGSGYRSRTVSLLMPL